MVGRVDGSSIIYADGFGESENPEDLGVAVADDLIRQGARSIMGALNNER